MKRTFLIARQEFIKYVTRRGFFISILMFPLWIMIVIFVPRWTGGGTDNPRVFTVVDRTGGFYRDAILTELARDNEERDLKALASYAQANVAVERLSPAVRSMLARPEAASSRRTFHAMGGMETLVAAFAPLTKPRAATFSPPVPRFIYHEPPATLAAADSAGIRAALKNRLAPFDFDTVVVIPKGFGPAAPDTAQIWSGEDKTDSLKSFIEGALSDALRLSIVKPYLPSFVAPQVLTPDAELTVHGTKPSDSGNALGEIVPIALAVILFVISVMNASVLLQGVIEEKSTRMIEVLLSCATPREITTGKLIGVIAVALTTLLIWGLVLLLLMALAGQGTVALVLTALRAIATLDTLPLLLLFFLCGLLIYGSLFLAIGSMANSLADAQSLLGPSMLILMLPNLMIGGIMHDPNGPLASGLTWVPIYTPFFMMLRLPSHPPDWQVWSAVALAAGTATLLIVWTGRVFARHALSTERPPSLGNLFGGLFRRPARS